MREMLFTSVGPDDVREVRRLLAAEGYIELGLFEEADNELRELDHRWFFLEPTLLLQLRVYAGLARWKEAHDLADVLSVQNPENPQWRIWSAVAASHIESVEAARSILLEALAQSPNDARIHYDLSCYETRLHHFRRAEGHLYHAIQLDPRLKLVAVDDPALAPLWGKLVGAAARDAA
jgi:tetratricopeptide (TPR) repeat protein